MILLYEFGRWSAVLLSLPLYWIIFKRKVYYEKSQQLQRQLHHRICKKRKESPQ